MNEYTYLGRVEETASSDEIGWQETAGASVKLARIEQKNKFFVGETIEIMKPDGKNLSAVAKAIYSAEGEAMESCPHAGQQVWVVFSEQAKEGDLLRRVNGKINRSDLERVKQ